MLKLRAIDFDYCARIAHQRLGRCFYDARLAGSCRPQKQKVPDGTTRGSHTRQMHLVNINDLLDSFVLADDHPS